MLTFLRLSWLRLTDRLGSLPVRCLRPAAKGSVGSIGGLCLYHWLFLMEITVMFCVPHESWDNRYAVMFAGITLLAYWWDCAARSQAPFNPGRLGFGVWLFLLMGLVSCLWAWDRMGGLRVAVFFLSGFALSYVCAAGFSAPRARNALCAVLYGVLIYTSLYGLIVYFTQGSRVTVPIGGVHVPRLCSTLEHGINYSEFIAMLLPLVLVWVLQLPQKKWRLPLAGLLLLPGAALLFTYGRTGWISLAAALLVLLWLLRRRLLIPAAILGGVGIFFLPHNMQLRLLSVLDFSDTAASGRFTLWRECLALWREHWLTGIGLGPENFYHSYLSFSTFTLPFDPPHSNMLYLEMAISLGIVGFAAFLGFFFTVLFRLGKAVRRCGHERTRPLLSGLLASLCGAAVGAIPEYIWFYPRILFCWCILYGLALGSAKDSIEQ